MYKETNGISIGTAAFIAGFPFMLLTAPFGEFYVFGELIVYKDGAQTAQNLLAHPGLFISGIIAMMLTFMYDIVLAWACYIFTRPVSPMLALLAAWFRLVYTALAMVALFNFLQAFHVANFAGIDEVYRHQQVWQLVNARRSGMDLAYIVFGVYLILVGILILKSSYIPNVFGVMIMVAGLSWIMISLRPYVFPNYDFSWMMFFAIGELAFAIWLLIHGTRIKQSQIRELAASAV